MVNGSSGREGTSNEARPAREEICHVSHGRDKDKKGAFDLSMGGLACHCLYSSLNTQLEKVNHSHWLDQVFGEPATIKYNECTVMIDIEKIMEDCKDPDKVSV